MPFHFFSDIRSVFKREANDADIALWTESSETDLMTFRSISLAILIILLTMSPAFAARLSLGIFGNWGAFRDDEPKRCYAISQAAETNNGKQYVPYLTVSSWPDRGIKGQVHIRLSRQRGGNSAVTVVLSEKRYTLVASRTDAWAPDQRTDAAIIAAIRGARSLSIVGSDTGGNRFVDNYTLSGAASAIDAARLGCAR